MTDRVHERIGGEPAALEVRAATDGDGLTLAGYVARFNEPTAISDFLGDYVERIAPGAFRRTLRERGAGGVKMQFDHGHDGVFGSLPIGVWTVLREDRHGLWGEGRILDSWLTLPIRAALEAGALNGMSFRFKAIAEEWTDDDERTLTEVALFEAGPVVHPAYAGTSVGLRSQVLDLLRVDGAAHSVAIERAVCATLVDEVAGPPVGADEAEHESPVGLTRRDMRLAALTRIGVNP